MATDWRDRFVFFEDKSLYWGTQSLHCLSNKEFAELKNSASIFSLRI